MTAEEWALAASVFFSGLASGLLGMLSAIMRPMLADELDYVVGVDTHLDEHVLAVVVAPTGAVVAQRSVHTSARGYAASFGGSGDIPEHLRRRLPGTAQATTPLGSPR